MFWTETVASASWWLATCAGTKLGIRDVRNLVHTDSANNNYYLSSVLRDDQREATSEFSLEGFRQNLPDTHRGNPIVVLQLLEDFEEELFNALPVGSFPDRNIEVRRLRLVDFSHAYVPSDDFQREFNAFCDWLKSQKHANSAYIVHCKAGVNRSFRTISALIALDKLNETPAATLQEILETVWETMNQIKGERNCVDFGSFERVLKQFSFVAALVGKKMGHGYEKMAMAIFDFNVNRYISELEGRANEYNNAFAPLLRLILPSNIGPQPKADKLAQASLLFEKVVEPGSSDIRVAVLAAGQQGKLGKIIKAGVVSGCVSPTR